VAVSIDKLPLDNPLFVMYSLVKEKIMKKSTIDRFMEKVYPEPNTGCWLWGSTTAEDGYGYFKLNYKQCYAHRVSWELYVKTIEGDNEIDHKCGVRPCVNPDHLQEVPKGFNQTQGSLRGAATMKSYKGTDKAKHLGEHNRKKTHCKQGHEFTPDNTYIYKNQRYCRKCHRISDSKKGRTRRGQ